LFHHFDVGRARVAADLAFAGLELLQADGGVGVIENTRLSIFTSSGFQ
jgi:hypothetical protein